MIRAAFTATFMHRPVASRHDLAACDHVRPSKRQL
jgi:hypothetical protein